MVSLKNRVVKSAFTMISDCPSVACHNITMKAGFNCDNDLFFAFFVLVLFFLFFQTATPPKRRLEHPAKAKRKKETEQERPKTSI